MSGEIMHCTQSEQLQVHAAAEFFQRLKRAEVVALYSTSGTRHVPESPAGMWSFASIQPARRDTEGRMTEVESGRQARATDARAGPFRPGTLGP